jgi:polyribonucleotide nucleotidyltransferase
LEKIRSNHPMVHVDLNTNVIRLRGKAENLAPVMAEILSYDCKRATLTISSKEIGLVVGKGGSNIQSMEQNHHVSVNVESNEPKGEAVIEIIGISSNVDEAYSVLKDLIYANEDVEELIMCTSTQRNMFLDNQAVVLKEIQTQMNEQGQGVLLTFEKNEDGSSGRGGPSKLIMKARRSAIEKVRLLVQQRLDAYDAGVIQVEIDASLVPKIIGKKGESIRKLEEECPGASFDVDKGVDRSFVTIHAVDQATRDGAIAKIQEIIDNNQVLKIDIEQNMIGQLLGEPGKSIRSQISAGMGVWMGLSDDDTQVIVQGSREKIEEAAQIVEQFIQDHFGAEFEIPPEDEQLVFAGGEKNILNTVEKDFGVKTTFIRMKLLVVVRGKEEDVHKAKNAIIASLSGGDGWYVARLTIPDKFKGIVVGRGGSNLAKLETDNEGLLATLLRMNNQLVLRSKDEAQVKSAKKGVVKMLATMSVTEIMPISTFYFEKLSANNMMRTITDGLNVSATLEKEELKLRGIELDVKEAKARIVEKMTGKYTTYMPLDDIQMSKMKKAGDETFKTIRDQAKTHVSLDEEEGGIKLEGSRTKVKKAKFTLLKFLDFILPAQFAKVNIPKQALRAVGDPALLADVAAESGAYLWLDRDLSCVFIRASDPALVTLAMKLFATKKDESDKFSSVIQLEDHETWLVPKILGKAGATINKCRKESGARIDLDKEDLVITISGEDEARQIAKEFLDNFIGSARKECAFVMLPAGAANAFIGKGGANVRKFEEDHAVSIDRERERPAVRVNGKEHAVAAAVAAIEEWVAKWEEENASKSISVQDSMISAIVGKGGAVVRAIEEETGCKINIDRKTSSVTARGQAREVAIQKIQEIIDNEEREAQLRAAERERQMKKAQAEAEAAQLRRAQEQAEEAALVGFSAAEDEKEASSEAPAAVAVPAFRSVPVGMTKEKKVSSVEPSKVSNQFESLGSLPAFSWERHIIQLTFCLYHSQPNPHVTKAGPILLDFLLNDGPYESEIIQDLLAKHAPSKEHWQTTSTVTANEEQNGGSHSHSSTNYYRGSGGLLVRL